MLTTQYQAIGTDFPLFSLLGYQTKEQLQKMADKIDLYLPHSHRKERQAEELAAAIVDDRSIRCAFCPRKRLALSGRLLRRGWRSECVSGKCRRHSTSSRNFSSWSVTMTVRTGC